MLSNQVINHEAKGDDNAEKIPMSATAKGRACAAAKLVSEEGEETGKGPMRIASWVIAWRCRFPPLIRTPVFAKTR